MPRQKVEHGGQSRLHIVSAGRWLGIERLTDVFDQIFLKKISSVVIDERIGYILSERL
jgi:hypothetical protein